MQDLLVVLRIVFGALLVGTIVIQSQGSGLGKAWGGGGEFYRSRRGVEKIVFRSTIVLAALFLLVSLASLMV